MRILIAILLTVLLVSCTQKNEKETVKKQDTVKTQEIKTDTSVKKEQPKKEQPKKEPDAVALKIKEKVAGEYYKKDIENGSLGELDRKFWHASADINGDGKPEQFVAFSSPYFCGTGGCTMLLLNDDLSMKKTFSVVGYPVIILASKTDGWNDIVVYSGGKDRVIKYNKNNYPGNPSTEPEFKGEIPKDAVKLFADIDKTEPVKF